MLRTQNRYPFQLCSSLVITKIVEQVHISGLDLFHHLRVRHKACEMDQQLGAASVQTVDLGGQTMTSWSLWWDMPVRLGEFSYVSFLHFYGLH